MTARMSFELQVLMTHRALYPCIKLTQLLSRKRSLYIDRPQ